MREKARASDPARTAQLTKRSAGLLGARYGLSTLLNIGNVFVLTWWLGPRVYGVFVTTVGITTFLASISRAGLDTQLVRSEESPENSDYQTVFNVTAIISLGLALLGVVATPLLRLWLRDTAFVIPYFVLLVTIPMIGLAGAPLARLERNLEFGKVAAIECGGQAAAFAVSSFLAWRGFGVWAPVTGHVMWQAFVLVVSQVVSGFRAAFRTDWNRARKMLNFGLGFSFSVRIWQLRTLVNPLIVGRVLGTESVAYVALAVRAVESLSFVRTAAGRVAIAALARIRENKSECKELLLRGAHWQIFTLGPLFCALALLGPRYCPILLGPRWTPALGALPGIAAAALIYSFSNLEASALFVIGKQWHVAQVYAWHVLALALGAFFLLPRLGPAGYGWAELLACTPFWLLHRELSKDLQINLGRTFIPATSLVAALMLSPIPVWRWVAVIVSSFSIAISVSDWLPRVSVFRMAQDTRADEGSTA